MKWAFARPRTAEACLRAMLPEALVPCLDWTTLSPEPASFVDANLSDRHSDLLYSARLRGPDDRPVLLYLLFEHQSSPDRWMALRMPHYALQVQRRWLDGNAGARLLPWVVPLVLYHGREVWRAAKDYVDLLELGELAGQRLALPSFPYHLLDLSARDESDLRLDALGLLVTRLLRHAWDGDLWSRLPGWGPTLSTVLREQGLDALHAVFRYIAEVSDDRPDPELRRWIARSLGSEAEDTMMSWAQQERREGQQEGRRALLLHLIRRRFGAISPELAARVSALDEAQLERWADALLDARSPEDLPAT